MVFFFFLSWVKIAIETNKHFLTLTTAMRRVCPGHFPILICDSCGLDSTCTSPSGNAVAPTSYSAYQCLPNAVRSVRSCTVACSFPHQLKLGLHELFLTRQFFQVFAMISRQLTIEMSIP